MRIGIVGGGISGLACAIALAQRDFEVVIFEQQSDPKEVGAGISIFANASRVLTSLEVDAALRPVKSRIPALQFRDGKSGRAIATALLGESHEREFGAQSYNLHRADLHEALMERARQFSAIRLRLGQRIVAVRDEGDAIVAQADDGESVAVEALIGADGIRSQVREFVNGPDKARFSGEVVWRALVERSCLTGDAATLNQTVWLGSDRHFLAYPVRDGALLNVGGFVQQAQASAESWTEPGTRAGLAAVFAEWCPAVRQIIDAADRCFVLAVHERDPLVDWRKGRVVLIGDAAHAMPPHMGQGAGMALEDALILAREMALHSPDWQSAFATYQSKRRDRVARVRASVTDALKLFRIANPIRRSVAHAGLAIMSRLRPSAFQERTSWLYNYDPTTV